MNGFKKVIQMITPYKFRVFSSLIFNIISTLFSIFSIGMMIPFLDVIFGKSKPIENYNINEVNFWNFDNIIEIREIIKSKISHKLNL